MNPDREPPVGAEGSELVGEFVRIYKRGKFWYANYQAGRKQHRVSLKTTKKKVAQRKALRIDAELTTGQWKPDVETASVETAVAAYTDFLKAEDRAPKTLVKYAKVFERVIALANERKVRDLAGIDLTFIDAYRRMRTDAKAQPKTRYTETVVIRQMVNFALARNMLGSDPLRGLKLKKPKPTQQPCWTRAEVLKILAATPPNVRPILTLLAETGLRVGEVQWLTWDDIDLTDGFLHVRPKDGWRLKTGDQRTVPLSDLAASVLRSVPRRGRWVFTMPPPTAASPASRQWTERRLLASLKLVLKSVGLTGKLHTFRHAFITHALLSGTSVAVVRSWVGHTDQRVIDLYTHVHDEASRAAMQRLGEANLKLQKKEFQG